MKLYIKYMVSQRCKIIVKEELTKMNLHFIAVDLGEIEIMENISVEEREQLSAALLKYGLELMEDNKEVLVEKIKNVVIEMVHYADDLPPVNDSDFISEKLKHSYTYLSNIFSEMKGITIQQFIIKNKVERIKELILYDDYNLTEIAYKLNYSSLAHLCNQFKKVTGLRATEYKHLKDNRRMVLEEI